MIERASKHGYLMEELTQDYNFKDIGNENVI
jgi:hypothetical protein